MQIKRYCTKAQAIGSINDAIKAWNLAPKEIHESLSYNIAKKNIKMFAKTLPV